MRPFRLILSLLALTVCCIAAATNFPHANKCNPQLLAWLQQHPATQSKSFSSPPFETTNLCLQTTQLQHTLRALKQLGLTPLELTDHSLVVNVPTNKIPQVAAIETVKRIEGKRRYHLHLDKARVSVDADRVHKGEDLQTPFTGKGVIIGVIDQGFQFDHAAFRPTPDSTRIVEAWWYRNGGYGEKIDSITATVHDTTNDCHATHVMAIAAGGSVNGKVDKYGIAPDAELVAISSLYLEDADILMGSRHVIDHAKQQGKPWVINMSLGSYIHEHDGTNWLEKEMDALASEGGHFVASSGNSGNAPVHASFTATSAQDETFFLLTPSSASYFEMFLTSTNSAGFEVCPYLFNTSTGLLLPISEELLKSSNTFIQAGVQSSNQKYGAYLCFYPKKLFAKQYAENYILALGVKPSAAGQTIHGWVDGDATSFTSEFSNFPRPRAAEDNYYTISSPAIARSAIAVGSYSTRQAWITLNNHVYRYSSDFTEGALSGFSSKGPTLDNTLLKPEVCAPGEVIISAYNEYSSTFQDERLLTDTVIFDNHLYYYGVMQGTSMSAPVVTGALALWLQAKPDLTHEQVLSILAQSSAPFSDQTAGQWMPEYGFGKLNVYEGLKCVLALPPTGIQNVLDTPAEPTFLVQGKQAKVLFSQASPTVHIQMISADGKVCASLQLAHVARGQEVVCPFHDLAPGVYILQVQTDKVRISKKVTVF